jgi:DNA-binding MarR family transcriptional regulator
MAKGKHKKEEFDSTSLGLLCWQLNNLWQRKIREALLPFELTHVQLILLKAIDEFEQQGKTATQIEVARKAQCDKMMASKVIRDLEKRKLIKRKPYHLDGRAMLIVASPDAKPLLESAIPSFERANEQFFQSLKGKQQRLERRLQKLLNANLSVSVEEEENEDDDL